MIEIAYAERTPLSELLRRRGEEAPNVDGTVAAIIEDVRLRGDAALREYSQKFDGVTPENLWVSREEIDAAAKAADAGFLAVLREAADNIRDFHRRQLRQGFAVTEKPGIVMGQRILPLARVGVYVPGGTAAYPSTVLMDVIPAQAAGVEEIVMATPPGKDGRVAPAILAAARVLGVDRILKAGGAQAVAALAWGTESVAPVDKIVGPGNIYVTAAKKLVFGKVGIDMTAGPSDILVVADRGAAYAAVAADMLGQAEHDPNAAAVLVATDEALARAVDAEIEKQLESLPRREIAAASIRANGRIIVAQSLLRAVEIANAFAPEHLELCVEDPFALLPLVRSAGSVFLGYHTPEALGDYFAGPNHTLPTGGTARFYSPLSVDDFIKKSSYLYYGPAALAAAAGKVSAFARAEGLEGHARSVEKRGDAGVRVL